MAQPPSPTTTVTNPRIAKLIELETSGRIKPQHQTELDTYRAQGWAPKRASSGVTESERTAAFLATRVAGGIDDIERATKQDPSAAKPSVLPVVAGMFGQVPRNYANSDERQRVENAQLDLLDSALTLGTGAAYTREQLEGYRQSYFPQLGEGEGAVADKQMRLRRLLESARVKSGGAAPLIEEALNRIGNPEQPTDNKERLNLLEAPAAALDVATGVRGGPLSVEVGDVSSPQTPEFRAGLNALLDDPNTTKDQILEYWDKNAPGALDKGADPRAAPLSNDRGNDETFTGAALENADAAIRGVADTATLGLATRAAALGDTVFNGGTYAENLARQRATDLYDEQVNPGFRFAGQLAGGIALPSGVAGAGLRAEEAALAAGRTAEQAKVAARYGVARRMGLEGAGIGGTYGFNSDYGDFGDRLSSGVLGAAGGGALGYGLGRLAARFGAGPSGGVPPENPAREVVEAGRRLDVPINAADVNPGARNTVAYLESTPGGSGPIQRNIATANERLSSAVEGLGQGGTDVGAMGVGDIVQNAGRRFIERSRQTKDKLYKRAESLAGDTRVASQAAVDTLDEQIARLSETPNANRGELSLLQDLRADLVDEAGNLKPLSVQAIRDLRTSMRGEIGTRNLTLSGAEARVNNVIDAASADIATALEANAPGAASAFRRADQFYKDRQTKINDVISKFIGPRQTPISAQQAFARIESMAGKRGDARRLSEMMGTLDREERRDVAATIAEQLGQRTPEDDFSPALFISHAAKISPEARQTIFGAEGARIISDLEKVSRVKRDVQRSLNNSRSGQVANYARMLSSIALGGAGGAAVGGPVGGVVGAGLAAGAGIAARNVSARALMNPRFAEWLAQGAKIKGSINSPVAQRHIAKLADIAAKNPTLRGDIEAIEQRIVSYANDNATRAAASGGNESDQ